MSKENLAKFYSSEIYAKTKKYQKKYDFGIGTGSHDTWNNESDAFKHTFGSADLALKSNLGISEFIGNYHEKHAQNNPPKEENMDKWNNAKGREIAKEIRKQYNPVQIITLINNGQMDDIIAQKIMQRMTRGELITSPKDKRSFKNLQQGSTTGFAADIPEDKIFTAEEIGKMKGEEFQKNEKAINKQMSSMGFPREYEAKEAVQNGTMIWVDSYVRDDGTEVRGYYRRR